MSEAQPRRTSLDQPEYWLARVRTISELEANGSLTIREAYKQIKATIHELRCYEKQRRNFMDKLAWASAKKPSETEPSEKANSTIGLETAQAI